MAIDKSAKLGRTGRRYCTNPDCDEIIVGLRTPQCPKCQTILKKDKAVVAVVKADSPGTVVALDNLGESSAPRVVKNFLPPGYERFAELGRPQIVHIPAGDPPFPLVPKGATEFPDDDVIIDWAFRCREDYLANHRRWIDNGGLAYWARHSVCKAFGLEMGSDEAKYVNLVIGPMPDIEKREVEA